MTNFVIKRSGAQKPPAAISIIPIATLILALVLIIVFKGADAVSEFSPLLLMSCASLAFVLALFTRSVCMRGLRFGFVRSARQILPAVPMLICIAMVATTWMMSGVVPALINYGLKFLNPVLFLVTTCVVCAIVSVLTGSSWSTIATIGVAFLGIGTVMGYSVPWISGAIISGAYFGDKVSPLSDTTVVASSTCGVDLFDHIRYLLITAVPAMVVALIIFFIKGIIVQGNPIDHSHEMVVGLHSIFNITPWVMVVPAITIALITFRVNTLLTLFIAAAMGLAGFFVFQPHLAGSFIESLSWVWGGWAFHAGDELLDNLLSTGGILGMLPTVELVLSALVLGCVLIGTGMLGSITETFTRGLKRRTSVVGATVGGGLFMNMCTADQYLSIILTGNMFRNVYRRSGLEARMLSRTLEDSVSVTSVLIPWNSCGVTQSAVLGVSTVVYFPFCFFNYLTPVMSLLVVWTGFKVRDAFVRPAIAK